MVLGVKDLDKAFRHMANEVRALHYSVLRLR
jgi:hypothetical protein